jgi:hypothetical protein
MLSLWLAGRRDELRREATWLIKDPWMAANRRFVILLWLAKPCPSRETHQVSIYLQFVWISTGGISI